MSVDPSKSPGARILDQRLPFGEQAPADATGARSGALTAAPESGWRVGERYAVVGRIRRIRYQSPDRVFVIASLTLDRGHPITIKGGLGDVKVRDEVRVEGLWTQSKFGEQLDVDRFEPVLPVTAKGVAKFLSTQMSGIGGRLAQRIVDHFGAERVISIIDNEPERLAEVDGIGKKKLAKAVAEWKKSQGTRTALLFLQSHGVSLALAGKIIKRYGEQTALLVRNEPYRLAREMTGIGFHTADRIAESLGVGGDSPDRIDAGLAYVLHESEGTQGHCYLDRGELVQRASELLGVAPISIESGVGRLGESEDVVIELDHQGRECVFSKRAWRAEVGVAGEVHRLLGGEIDERREKDGSPLDLEALVERVGSALGLELAATQKEAVRSGLEGKMTIVTGGPGTGKTTLILVLVEIARRLGLTINLSAPTGRAAKRMTEATGQEAKTIHRLLEFSFQSGGFQRNASDPLEGDLFVVDEVSMIDIYLMRALLEALPEDAGLILVGDVDQLPSVGPGTVLNDLIASQAIPTVRLDTVFRQDSASLIVLNAHRINRGEVPVLPNHKAGEPVEYFAVNAKSPAQAEALIVELVTKRLPKAFDLDPHNDIQVLCPMRVREAGADSLNLALQAALNPDGRSVGRKSNPLRVGDRVMQIKNNYDKDVFNGDVGRLKTLRTSKKEIVVQFEEREVIYTLDELNELVLAYACTVHKAQGSEYPAVVIPLLRSQYRMLQRNLVYTALTRARRLAIFVGQPAAMQTAVTNDRPSRRNTRLAERLGSSG